MKNSRTEEEFMNRNYEYKEESDEDSFQLLTKVYTNEQSKNVNQSSNYCLHSDSKSNFII